MSATLEILVPTVTGRADQFRLLWEELCRQALPFGDRVQGYSMCDDKTMSIGAKRQKLLDAAIQTHVVFFDDDDWPYPHYVADIMSALASDPDCVGQVIDMTYDGQPSVQCVHSLRFKTWSEAPVKTPGYGRVFLRNVTHRNPCRTSIARQVGFPDLRFGEDKVYSDGVTALCKTEVMVERPGFVYRYSSKEPHNLKYGIQ